MEFLDAFKQLCLMGEHPCGCGALMIKQGDIYKCPECGDEIECDSYGYYMEEIEERENPTSPCPDVFGNND